MNEILLFGDSFADNEYRFNGEKTWYDKLDIKKNYAIQGIGITRLIKIFENEIQKFKLSDLNDKFLLIILADCYRFDFDYLPDIKMSANAKMICNYKNADVFLKDNNILKHIDFYRTNFDRIKRDYDSFYSNLLNQLLPVQSIHYFLNFSSYFKKVILWPSNQVYLENEVSRQIGCDFNIVNELIVENKNLYFVRKSFYDIVLEQDSNENLNNHLEYENHEKVFNLIYNWFFKNKKVNYDN